VLPNRVDFNEDVFRSFDRIPFLKRFLKPSDTGLLLSTPSINEYMGFHYVDFQSPLTSMSINGILEEAEKRGDLPLKA